ncbi:hypothetical protein DL98DRAFT_251136 [Cadophora sp. DSE1049]|nr:hypothetical protein DL98DRAFT_251136 [Cadophora sp. DSE1049]
MLIFLRLLQTFIPPAHPLRPAHLIPYPQILSTQHPSNPSHSTLKVNSFPFPSPTDLAPHPSLTASLTHSHHPSITLTCRLLSQNPSLIPNSITNVTSSTPLNASKKENTQSHLPFPIPLPLSPPPPEQLPVPGPKGPRAPCQILILRTWVARLKVSAKGFKREGEEKRNMACA